MHRLVVSYHWPLPEFSNRSLFIREVLGNWGLTGVLSATSGSPITVTAGQDQSQTDIGSDRAVIVGPGYGKNACGNQSRCISWLNPDSFVLPPIGTFGNTTKGQFVGPGDVTWDMGLLKNFPFGERFKLQFRAEFFNVLNHTNLGGPSSEVSGGGFGTITDAEDPRIGQLALKVLF